MFRFVLIFSLLISVVPAARAQQIPTVTDLCSGIPVGAGSIDAVTLTQITDGGMVNRYACTFQPSTFNPAAANKLVVVLHGGNGNATTLSGKGLQVEAEARGYLISFAQGWPHPTTCPSDLCTVNGWDGGDTINGVDVDVAEINQAFISILVDAAVGDYNIDPSEVYLAGFSGGAKLIYRLMAGDTQALLHPFQPAAVATMAGSVMSVDVPANGGSGEVNAIHVGAGARPVPALVMQGLQDDRVPFYGGFNHNQSKVDSSFFEKIDLIRSLNAAFGAAVQQPPQWVAPLGGRPAQVKEFSGLAPVVSVAAQQLDHQWPTWYAPLVFDFFDAM
ncbi:hypothetical protein LCL97_13460 [Seohaeicola saemankumensis]|nr:hypothetical protein [Seohaeicola saemankumensis]MCA0871840.1 hypothetical protein [Seohaeicola saemankumensis]